MEPDPRQCTRNMVKKKKKPANAKQVKKKNKPAKQANKKPAARRNSSDRSGPPGGGNRARAEARYKSRKKKGRVQERGTQWDVESQNEAERQLQKWLLMQKAKVLEQEIRSLD